MDFEAAQYTVRSFAPESDLPALSRLLASVEATGRDGTDVSDAAPCEQMVGAYGLDLG